MFAPYQKSIGDTLNMADCLVVIVGEGNDGAVCDGLLSIIDGFSDEGCIRSSRYGMNNVEIFHTEFLVSVQQMSVPLKWRGTDVCQTDAEFFASMNICFCNFLSVYFIIGCLKLGTSSMMKLIVVKHQGLDV